MAFGNTIDEVSKRLKEAAYQKMVDNFVATGQVAPSMNSAQGIWIQQNPEVAKNLAMYGQRKALGGGVTEQEIQTLTSPSFYTPNSYGELNKGASRQGIIDQAAFINMHREEGYWDEATNDPSWWSDAYLQEQLAGYDNQIRGAQAIEELKESYNNGFGWPYRTMSVDDLLAEFGGDEEMLQGVVEDWLRAYNVTGNNGSWTTWEDIQSIADQNERYAKYHELQNNFGKNVEALLGRSDNSDVLSYRKEAAQREQAYRQRLLDYEQKLNDPQYRNTMILASATGQVEVEGETYPNLFLWATANKKTNLLMEYEDRGYGFMTPDELVTYQRLYELNENDAAGYLDALQRELYYRRSVYRDMEKGLQATDNFWRAAYSWAEAVGTPIENILTGDIFRQTFHALTGDADPNAYYYDALNDQSSIRTAQKNEIEENYGEVAAFFYDAFNSIADVGLTSGLDLMAGGTGLINAGLNATKAYSSGLQSNASRDIQGLWSIGQALGDAGIEALFEKLGFDGSQKSASQIWNFLRNAFGEGMEEVFTNMGTTAFDVVMSAAQGRDNTLQEMYKAYVLAGVENPGMQVLLDKVKELGTEFTMGSIAGGALGGAQNAVNAIKTRGLGKQLAPKANEDALLNIAREMPEGSESRKLAEKYFPQTLTGETVSEEKTEAAKAKKPGKLETPVALDGDVAKETEAEPAKPKKPGLEKPVELTGDVAFETTTETEKSKKPGLHEAVALDGEVAPEAKAETAKPKKPGLDKPVALDGDATPDTKSENAEGKKDDKKSGTSKKKLSFYQLGKLAQALEADISEQHATIVNDVADKAIADRLVELGETTEDAKKVAPIVRKLSRGQKIALNERMAVNWSDNATQVVKELSRETNILDAGRTGNSWRVGMKLNEAMATASIRETAEKVGNALRGRPVVTKATTKAKERASKMSKNKGNVTSKMINFSDSADGVEHQGEFKRFKKHGELFKMVILEGDEEVEITIDDIVDAEGSGVAEVIAFVVDGALHDMSEAEANALMTVYEINGGDASSVINDFEMVYMAEYSGQTVPTTSLTEKAADVIREIAREEARKDDATRVERASALRAATKGTTTFIGKVKNNAEITERKGKGKLLSEVADSLTESQLVTAEIVSEIAKKLHVNVELYESDLDSLVDVSNGMYDSSTNTISVDINSGVTSSEDYNQKKKSDRLGFAMMKTLGHELTHHLEATSANAYTRYRDAVRAKLVERGENWIDMVNEKIRQAANRGYRLTRQGAESEVVADTSEFMLQNSSFVKSLDETLSGKIKTFVKSFVAKINEVFQKISGGYRGSNILRQTIDGVTTYMYDLQELWDAALMESVNGTELAAEGTMMPALPVEDLDVDLTDEYGMYPPIPIDEVPDLDSNKQFSARVTDEETIAYLENQQHITTYRAMQVIDGKLYPPMAEFIGSKKDGNREDASEIGHWEMATEHPELIKWVDGKPKFELKKVNDDGSVSTVPAAYNPYMHSSNTVLNDQFSKAFQRKNLVVVECVVPVSESNGAYHAQYAKDATGWHEWKSGIVAGELAKQKNGFRRDVFLSRYIKPVRILSEAEVAKKIAGYLDGTDVTIPFQSAWPTLRDALVQEGVNVTAPRGLGSAQQKIAMDAFEEWKRTRSEQMETASETKQYSARDNYLLNSGEYARFKRNWESRKNNHFTKRHNGGILIDMGNLLVYTDRKGTPQHVLEVLTDDLWTDNDIVQKAVLLETEGYDIDEQQEILESTCGTESFRFRVPGDSSGNRRKTGEGKGQDSRNVRRTNREEQPAARTPNEVQVKQAFLRDDTGFTSEAMETVTQLETKSGSKLFSLRSMTEDYETYRTMLTKAGVQASEISDLFYVIDETMKVVAEHKDILDFGWNVGRNDRSFSPVKPNSDNLYKVSLDFSSLCRKRLLQQAVQERLEALHNTVLTKAERVAIRNALMELREQGKQIEVACALCYVESARLKSPAQIQRFFDDRRAVLVDYFAKKNKAYMKQVNARANELIVKFGNEPGAKKKNLNSFQKNAVTDLKQSMYKEYKPTAEEEAIIKTAQELPGEAYRSAAGLWALKREHEVIFDAYTSYVRNATKSKGIEGDEAWWAGDSKKISNALIKKMNAENGLRSQSWSDFQVIHLLDYMAAIIELSTRNAKMQTYTKVPDFVKLMGDTGIMINLSLIPKGFDGTLNYDPIEGMPIETALALREMFPETAGTICIGITDEHIRMLLADNTIDYVIPYHASSLDKETRQQMGMKVWDDFTDYQNEKEVEYPETVKGTKVYHKKPNFSDWFDYETVSKRAKEVGAEQAMREAADRYIDLCHRRGLQEKFPQFATEANYWKLLIDRKMINQQTGEIINQQAVKPLFDIDRIREILLGEVERFNAQNKDFNEAIKYIEKMWADGDIQKAAKSKKVQNAVSAFDASVIVQNIVESAKELGNQNIQHSIRTEQTETPEFKRWFGNSKVVDADGNPKVMYHGTNADKDFTVFNTFGSNFGLFGIGSYFTDDRNVAESYTHKGRGNNPRVYEVYLSIQNPLDMDAPFDPEVWNTDDEYINRLLADSATNEDAFRKLKQYCADEDMYRSEAEEFITEYILDMGFDGIRHTGGGRYNKRDTNRHTVFIAFEPEQIKSATDNIGTFDPQNPDIRHSERITPDDVDIRDVLAESGDIMADTVEERNALTLYQKMLKNHAEASDAVEEADRELASAVGDDVKAARRKLAAAQARQRDIYDRLTRVENTKHVQQIIARSSKVIREELIGKTRAQIARTISDNEKQLEKLSADLIGLKGAARTQTEANIRDLNRKLAHLKSQAAEKLLKQAEHYRGVMDRKAERQKLAKEVNKQQRHIKSVVRKLNDRIVHETDYKNVKEDLKPAVRELVGAFIDGFGSLVFTSKQADRLKVLYDALDRTDDGSAYAYSDDVSNWLEDLAKLAAEDQTRRLGVSGLTENLEQSLEIYTKVAEIADHMLKLVKDADTMFRDGRRMTISTAVSQVNESLSEKKDRTVYTGAAAKSHEVFDDMIRLGNMTPTFFFEHLKNPGMQELFDDIMNNGQYGYSQAMLEGKNFVEDAQKRYHFYEWSQDPTEFKTEQGHNISLTVAQKLWVYATAKREASNPIIASKHLEEGGFVYDEKGVPKDRFFRAKEGSKAAHKLSGRDVKAITDTLTAEQKAYADELVEYLSTDMAELGNRASMELFGIKKYTEKYYFPFKVDQQQLHQRSDAGSASTTSDSRVKHRSFTHALRKGANQTLVMGDFTDIINDHINQMATYANFVVPIENMNRVLNSKVADGDSDSMVTIRSMIGRKYGASAQKYVADLMKDMNGGMAVDQRGSTAGLIRLFKQSAVVGSGTVFVQQFTSYVRAFGYIAPKYFAHLTGESNRSVWERAMKYSGTAVIKDMGRFDVGVGMAAKDWLGNADLGGFNTWKKTKFLLAQRDFVGVKNAWVDFLTALPGWADRVTWTHIWKAVEAEQRDVHPEMDHNSDAFYHLVGHRFDDVINHTQVYDSILAKSQNMRSKNPWAQMSTAFMAEPTLNLNLLYSAITGEHSGGQRVRIVSTIVLANVLAAATAAAISAWNDDDDERTAIEKYLSEFSSRTFDNLNVFGWIPYVSDLVDIFSGYDPERIDLSLVKDLFDYSQRFANKLEKGETITWKDVEDLFGTVANFTGVPAKNWSRDVRRLVNLITSRHETPTAAGVKYSMLDGAWWWDDANKAYYQRYVTALMDGDKQLSYDLKDYMVGTKMIKEETFVEQARAEYGKRYKAGGIEKQEAVKFLLDNKLADKTTSAFKYVDKWEEGTENYSQYNTLREAIRSGNSATVSAAWDELTKYGFDDDDIASYTRTSIIKDMVVSGEITAGKATELLRKYAPYKKDSDNINKPKEWLENKDD